MCCEAGLHRKSGVATRCIMRWTPAYAGATRWERVLIQMTMIGSREKYRYQPMKYFILALTLISPCFGSNPYAMNLDDFKGDRLVIGTGNFRRADSLTGATEYSIDINRRALPNLVADGLDAQTYASMPDNRFELITFEHISFCPYYRPHLMAGIRYQPIESGLYSAEAWEESRMTSQDLPMQLLRILRPGGSLIFRTAILEDKDDFSRMCLAQGTDGPLQGFKAWQHFYEQAGFNNIEFEVVENSRCGGWYAQMTAEKPRPLKQHKCGNE